jgi:hypothetical protein
VIEFAVAGLSDPVQATVPWLSLSILVPIGGALLIPFIPDQGEGKQIRWYALIVTLITFLITVAAYLTGYDPSLSGLQLFERVSWLPEIGLTWTVGADGLSMPLILLTSFITSLACLAAWPVTFKPRLFFFLLTGNGWRPNRRFCRARHAAVLLGMGARTSPGLPATCHLGRQKTPIRCHQIHSLHRRELPVHPLGCSCHGVFRRRNAKLRIHSTGCERLWQWLPVAVLRGTTHRLRGQAADCAPAYLATGCPWRSHSARAHAAGWHPSEDGWLRPTAIQL